MNAYSEEIAYQFDTTVEHVEDLFSRCEYVKPVWEYDATHAKWVKKSDGFVFINSVDGMAFENQADRIERCVSRSIDKLGAVINAVEAEL